MLETSLDAVLLFGVEPDLDLPAERDPAARLGRCKFVAAMTPFASADLLETAHLLLPIGTFAETAGTYVNCEGRWQSFNGIAAPVGEARPGWKVLRVLGNLAALDGFDYASSEEVRDELRERIGSVTPDNRYAGPAPAEPGAGEAAPAGIDVPMYEIDPLVRRATALQLTAEARRARAGESAA
jgi:NADH-quinone oxidoreductase subunit G